MPNDAQREPSDWERDEINKDEAALTTARETGDKHAEAHALYRLGGMHRFRREIPRAIYYYQAALTISYEISDKSQQADNLAGLGHCYSYSPFADQDDERAKQFYEQALAAAREIDDRKREGDTLADMGNVLSHQSGQQQAAMQCFQQALVIARDLGDKRTQAINLGSIGYLNRKSGQFREAIDYIEQAISAYQSVEDVINAERLGEAIEYGEIASIYLQLGENQQAISHFDRGLAVAEISGRPDIYRLYFTTLEKQINDLRPKSEGNEE